jgi:hypothetical protein
MAITRADAIREILAHVDAATDEELAGVLFVLCGDQTLHNFMIVATYDDAKNFSYAYDVDGLGERTDP